MFHPSFPSVDPKVTCLILPGTETSRSGGWLHHHPHIFVKVMLIGNFLCVYSCPYAHHNCPGGYGIGGRMSWNPTRTQAAAVDTPVRVIFHWKTERPYQNGLISALTHCFYLQVLIWWKYQSGKVTFEKVSCPSLVKNEGFGGYVGSLQHLASVQHKFHLK